MILLPAIIGGAILALVGYIAAVRESHAKQRQPRKHTDNGPRAVAR